VEPITLVTVGGAVWAAMVALHIAHRRRARRHAWREAARLLALQGVTEVPGSGLAGPALTAGSGPLRLRLEGYRRGRSETGTRLRIEGLGHPGEGLSLRREGLSSRLFGNEIEIGDPAFDREIRVQGAAALALAVLAAPTRDRLRKVFSGQAATDFKREWIPLTVELERGVLTGRLVDQASESDEHVWRAVEQMLAVARLLAAPADLPARLAESFADEPEAGVRWRIVETLAREHPDHPETPVVLRAARRDPDGEVRLRGAAALKAEGYHTLVGLAANEETDDSRAARALAALGTIGAIGAMAPADKVAATLTRALTGGRPQTAQACIAYFAANDHPAGEELLLQALGSGEPEVATAAAQALGRRGTAAAVAGLREAADAVLPSALRSAARQAIAEIQARVPGAAPGQLALAEGQAGSLSLPDAEPGALSLPRAPGPGRSARRSARYRGPTAG
jgi:HEAT repeats